MMAFLPRSMSVLGKSWLFTMESDGAPNKTFNDPDWVRCAYKIFDPTRKKGSLDIPPDLVDSRNYCATLAHKTNHSFLPSAEFDAYDHPRFGLIPCLVADTEIKADQEIFVHYSYGADRAPDWYLAQWSQGDYPVPDSLKDPDNLDSNSN